MNGVNRYLGKGIPKAIPSNYWDKCSHVFKRLSESSLTLFNRCKKNLPKPKHNILLNDTGIFTE